MDVTPEWRRIRQRRIRREYRTPSPPMPSGKRTERVILPPLFIEEDPPQVIFCMNPKMIKTVASLLTNLLNDQNPGDYMNSKLKKIMSKHKDFDVYIIVELFYECLDRKMFLETLLIAFRTSPFGVDTQWSIFAKYEFYVISYIIVFEAARIPEDNLYEVLTEFKWDGARHYYRYLVQELRDGVELFPVIENMYSPEYLYQKILPNLQAARLTLKRVVNDIIMALMESKPKVVKRNLTAPEPFHFHVTNPKLIDYEIHSPKPFRAGVVPKTQFVDPLPSPRYQKSLLRNRTKASNLLTEVNQLTAKSSLYRNKKKSDRYLEDVRKIKLEREEEIARRAPSNMPKIPLEEVFQEPATRGKTTYSDLLRQRQLCVQDETRKQQEIDELVIGRDANKIRDYIKSRNKESLHLEILQKNRLILRSKISFQKAIAAPRKVMKKRQEQAQKIREKMRRDEKKYKEKRRREILQARIIAKKVAQENKIRLEKHREMEEQEKLAYCEEMRKLADARAAEQFYKHQRLEKERAEKLMQLKAKAGKNYVPQSPERLYNYPRSKCCLPPFKFTPDPPPMTDAEVSIRMDKHKREESEKLANRHNEIQMQKFQENYKFEKVKQEIEECRSAKKPTLSPRVDPFIDINLDPCIDPVLGHEVDILMAEFQTLKLENEMKDKKKKSKRAGLKTARSPTGKQERNRKIFGLEVQSARPSTASEAQTPRAERNSQRFTSEPLEQATTGSARNSLRSPGEPAEPATGSKRSSLRSTDERAEPATGSKRNSRRSTDEPAEPATGSKRNSLRSTGEPAEPATGSKRSSLRSTGEPAEVANKDESENKNEVEPEGEKK